MRAGTYIKYVATCLPTALIGIGIFLAIFRANPHLGLYSGIAALIVWGLTMAALMLTCILYVSWRQQAFKTL